eukprot:g14522.t1
MSKKNKNIVRIKKNLFLYFCGAVSLRQCSTFHLSAGSQLMFFFAEFIFRVLVQAPFYVFLAAISLLNLKGMIVAMHQLATQPIKETNFVLETLKPFMAELQPALKTAFGPASKFSFDLSHILLMAILLAVLNQGGKLIEVPQDKSYRESKSKPNILNSKFKH